jgi:hypothetical protein
VNTTAQDPASASGLIDREKLAARWCCSIETIKRIEKRGLLSRVHLAERMVRYRLSEVLKIEAGKEGKRK